MDSFHNLVIFSLKSSFITLIICNSYEMLVHVWFHLHEFTVIGKILRIFNATNIQTLEFPRALPITVIEQNLFIFSIDIIGYF